jgi:hypothetical protein
MTFTKINTQRRAARNMRFMAFFGLFMAISPWLFDINPMDGGGALLMVGILLGLTGLIAYFIFNRRAKLVDDMFEDKNVLAHWRVDGLEWDKFSEEDTKATKTNAWGIWGVITFFFAILIVVFWLFIEDTDDANFFAMLMGGIWLFISIFAFIATSLRTRKRGLEGSGEVIIAKNGLWLNGESHIWKGLASSLDLVQYHANKRILEFGYSFPAQAGRQSVEVRVPVPAKAIKELDAVMAYFGISKQSPLMNPVKEKFSGEDNSFSDEDEDAENSGFEVTM